MKILAIVAAAAISSAAAGHLPDVPEIVLQAKPACGHLQEVCFDGERFLYWAHTKELYKTDLEGRVLATAAVKGHHAGLEVKDGRLFVAVCPMQGKTGGRTTPECRLAVGEYDADTLALVRMHVTDINDRAGSLAILPDGTFLVGCLRPPDILPTQVRFHHLDKDFNLIKSHVLDNVPVKLGIEVIKRRGNDIFLDMYGVDKDDRSLGFDAVRLGPDFRENARGRLGGAMGLVFDGDFAWTAWSRKDAGGNAFTSKIVRKQIPEWCVGAAGPQGEIRAMMLKLGSNTHAEPLYPSVKPANQWDYEHTVADELRLDEDVWREVTDAMAAKGYNMVVIGVAEGVVYPSHPELAVKGSWSVEKLKAELKRLRAMGLEPIPKMNFAASHDTWLGEYHRMVSTETYYKVCADVIRDVVEIFDHPRFLHLGYDEEMPIAQAKSAYMVVRQGELWWHDFDFFRKEVEKHGVRAWIWSDYFWHHPKEFLERMPKSVLQSNWYYRTDFGEKVCDRAKMEKAIMAAGWPEVAAGPSTYVEFEKAGYDQLPCGSVWANDGCMAATVRFCRSRIAKPRLKGFLMAPWLATLKSNREQLLFAVETGAKAFAADPQPPEMVWVENGACTMPIVASKDKKTQQAAKYLADCVEEMTGVRPEIKGEWTGRAIRLETTAKPDDESFRTVTKYGSVFMTGAAYHAAYDFAERVLGVRQYWPTKDGGRSVVKTGRIAIPQQDFRDAPFYKKRNHWPHDATEYGAAMKPGDSNCKSHVVHAPHKWAKDTNYNYRATRPEIFELRRDGKRGAGPMLCYGNPKTLETYKERIVGEIEHGRSAGGIVSMKTKCITVSQWDGGVACTCDFCRRLRDTSLAPTGDGSPIIWGWFVRELSDWLATRYPDWTITILPYINTCAVPPGLVYTNRNVEAFLCVMPGLAMLKQPEVKAREESLIRAWAKATGRKVQVWHYDCWPAEFTCAPYVYGETIAAHYRDCRDVMVGTFINGGSPRERRALSDYVWMKAMWNPNIDVHGIYDEFCERMFGAGAKPMRELVRMQETGWNRPWKTAKVSNKNIYEISYPRAEVLKMRSLIEDARRLAAGDAPSLSRIAYYAKGFDQFFRESEEYASGSAFAPMTMQKAPKPTVDGALDEGDWGRAEAQAFVAALDRTNSVARYRTELRVLWAPGEGVTFGVRCLDPDMAYLKRVAAPGTLSREQLEFFFDPTGNGEGGYAQIGLDINGNRTLHSHEGGWKADGIESAVKLYDDRWEAELFVPFSALAKFPDAQIPTTAAGGRFWSGNVCRMRYGQAKPNGGTGGIKSYFWTPEFEMSRLHTRYSNWNRDAAAFGRLQFVE